jgi:ferredoxin
LENPQCTKAKIFPKDREKSVKELSREAKLREQKHNDLSDDQEAIKHCPKHTRLLIWNGATTALAVSDA